MRLEVREDAAYVREKARVLKSLKKWKKQLARHWDVTYVFSETLEGGPNGYSCVMRCAANWPYRKATIYVALSTTAEMDDEHVENAVVHEFLHAIVNQMREVAPDSCSNCGSNRTVSDGAMKHEEAVVQNLTDIILGVA